MKKFNKESKTAMVLGAVLMSTLVAAPVSAKEMGEKEFGNSSDFGKQMRMHIEDDDFRGNFDDDHMKGPKINPEDIRKALESKDFTAFSKILTDAKFPQVLTQAQFDLLVQAYGLAKTGDIQGAQKILKDNNLAPMLNGFIMGQHMQLTDAQKEAIKKAEDLMKQGKTDEAKAVIAAAGLPQPPVNKAPVDAKKEAIKTALDKAKILKSEGKIDEAKQVLKDAGITEKSAKKLEKEFNKDDQKERKSLVGVFKKFFKFGKN